MSDRRSSYKQESDTSSPAKFDQPAENQKNTLLLLKAYTKTYKTINIGFNSFVNFVLKYVEQYGDKYRQLLVFSKNTADMLTSNLDILAKKKKCVLSYGGKGISSISYPQYLITTLKTLYDEMQTTNDLPFPTEDSLGIIIPPNQAITVDIKNEFPNLLRQYDVDDNSIIRITFPENLDPIIITYGYLKRPLAEKSVDKIRLYLSQTANANFAQTRLSTAFTSNQNFLKEMINSVMMKPSKAVSSLIESNDLSFRFWANISDLITKEYHEKKDMLASKHSICQAAYILAVLNVYFREFKKKDVIKEKVKSFSFEARFKKAPYIFTLNDLYTMKNEQGAQLTMDELQKADLNEFLDKKTKARAREILPEIVRLRAPDNNYYYVLKERIPAVFIKSLYEVCEEVENNYTTKWLNALWREEEQDAMHDDSAFLRNLSGLIRAYYPVFYALLNYTLLNGVERETNISHDLVPDFDRCLDRKNHQLKPLNEILRLNRKDIIKKAKRRMPVWSHFKLSRKLILILSKWLKGPEHKTKGSASPARVKKSKGKAQAKKTGLRSPSQPKKNVKMDTGQSGSSKAKADARAAYNRALLKLKEQLIGKNASLPKKLDALVDKWNPLFDPKARQNLILDVDSMVRDFVRGLRKSFGVKPPDAGRIKSLAKKLSENPVFARIKQKEYFKSYIELYILKLLGEK